MSRYVRQEKSQRKHPVASSSSSLLKPPVIPTAPKDRPGWKGPGFVKKAQKQPQPPQQAGQAKSTRAAPAIQEQYLPLALQQLLLNVLRISFPVCEEYETLKPMLQGIRSALSEGDSSTAFSRLDWMEAYAVRWSSTRALCCANVLVGMFDDLREDTWVQNLLGNGRAFKSPSRVVCFGGGSTEVLAFAAVLRHIRHSLTDIQVSNMLQPQTSKLPVDIDSTCPAIRLNLVDKQPWGPAVWCLEKGLLTPPPLSKYASQAARLKNISFIQLGDLSTNFLQNDVLGASQDDLLATIGLTPSLVTFFFTLDDLQAASTAKAAALLLKLTLVAPKDSLLLIIDSPESPPVPTEVEEPGKEKKRYQMGKWLDLVLMDKVASPGVTGRPAWEELVRDENRLFKLDEGLKFPISLDHVMFQMHLFRKRR